MVDYLNELMLLTKGRSRDGTYNRAMKLKMRGDAIIFNQLAREWISRFKWEVPQDDTCAISTELIERAILFGGMAAFRRVSTKELVQKSFSPLKDKEGTYGDVETQWRLFCVSGTDNLSFYGYPTRAYLTSFSGASFGYSLVQEEGDVLNREDMCVIAMDSPLGSFPYLTVLYYAEKMSMIETSINAAIQNILGTTIITCPKEQEKQVLKERKAAQVGVPWVVRYDEIYKSSDNLQLLTTDGATEALKTLYEAQNKVHADYLQSIGIRANNEVDKRTGVTPLEIVQSRQNVDIILNNAFMQRQKAVRQLEKAGLKGVKVNLENFDTLIADYDAQGNRLDNAKNGSPLKEKEGEE